MYSMGFIKKILELFESIFNRSSPEVQKKIRRRKMEGDLEKFTPVLYRNGNITANFAEAMYILYLNTKSLDNLFCETIGGTDIPRQTRFKMQLVFTGFSADEQMQVESLSYENRKQEVKDEKESLQRRVYEQQYARLERIVSALNSDSFKSMDKNLLDLRQFADLCHFNFVSVLHLFDKNFVAGVSSYKPSYQEVPISTVSKMIDELYYQIAGLTITNATANGVAALVQLRYGDSLTQDQKEAYLTSTRKIASVINHVLQPDHLKALIQLAKEEPGFEPAKVSYKESARQDFSTKIQTQFKADEQRIRTELKDEKIQAELYTLFSGSKLLSLSGYTPTMNEKLHEYTALSFEWIMPVQVLKTFLQVYLSPQIHALLNDIVVEGFFNNQSYKSEFSTIVYAALECKDHVQLFEQSFDHGKQNDNALLEGYIHDSRKDETFHKRVEKMVESINNQARQLVQEEVSALQAMYGILTGVLADAKKPGSELIQNLKVLLLSPRNKENTDLLERQFPNWAVFFEIMSNYVTVNIKEKK